MDEVNTMGKKKYEIENKTSNLVTNGASKRQRLKKTKLLKSKNWKIRTLKQLLPCKSTAFHQPTNFDRLLQHQHPVCPPKKTPGGKFK